MSDPAQLPLWPDTVDAFYADRACSIRSAATRTSWGYTYRRLQRLHPSTAVGEFRTDDLVAFVTQRGWGGPRWASSTARNYRVALQSLFGWAHHAERIPIDPAWRLGHLVRIRRVRVWQPHWLTEPQIAALLGQVDDPSAVAQRDRTLLMLGLFAGLRTGEMHRLRWRNVAIDAGTLEIVGKGDKPATVATAPQLRGQLRAWRHRLARLDAYHRDWPVLPILTRRSPRPRSIRLRQPVQAISIERIRQIVHRYGDAIGVDYLRPHDLRRSLAGTLDARGVPLADIRLILRHDTIAATHTYLQDNPLRARRWLEGLSFELVGSSPTPAPALDTVAANQHGRSLW